VSRRGQPLGAECTVFINYRTEDEPFGAALVDHELSARFGSDQVFRASKSIRPGDDFAQAIIAAVRHAAALLVIIGPRWLTATDDSGQRRLDLSDDWVRLEIAEALRHRVRVIPLLVNVDMPLPGDLPPDITALARCQYLRLHHRNSRHDINRLADELFDLIPELSRPARRRSGRRRVTSLAGLVVTVSAVVIFAVARFAGEPQTQPPEPNASSSHTGRGEVIKQGQLTLKAEDDAYLEGAIVGTRVPVTDIYFPTVTGPATAMAIAPQGSATMTNVSGPVDRGKCERALNGRQDSFEDIGEIGVGGWICVRTNAGDIAGLQILTYSLVPQQVIVKFTVWRP
jgi:hypothetical protein